MMKKLKLGTIDLVQPSTVVSSYVPSFGLFEMPYLVKDRDHMARSNPLVDHPTRRLLRFLILEEEEMTQWGETALAAQGFGFDHPALQVVMVLDDVSRTWLFRTGARLMDSHLFSWFEVGFEQLGRRPRWLLASMRGFFEVRFTRSLAAPLVLQVEGCPWAVPVLHSSAVERECPDLAPVLARLSAGVGQEGSRHRFPLGAPVP